MIRSVPIWVWFLFALAAIGEIYFFLMQRSALELCRAVGLPERTRFLIVPSSYRLAWWAVAVRWLGIVLLAWYGGIFVGVAAVVALFIITAVVPVPHRLFLPAFEARVIAIGGETDPTFSPLLEAIRGIRTQVRV